MAATAPTSAIERARSGRPMAMVGALQTLGLDCGGCRLKFSRGDRNGSSFVDYSILGVDFVRQG